MKIFLFLLVAFLPFNAHSGWDEALDEAINTSKEYGEKAYEKSKEYGGKIYEESKGLVENSSEYATDLYEYTKNLTKEERQLYRDERFNEIWVTVLDELEDGLEVFDKIKEAPDSSWIKDDKKSLRKDFNEILDELIVLLDDNSIKKFRQTIDILKNNIKESKNIISEYKEKRIIAPTEHVVKTTKKDYDEKIASEEKNIDGYNNEIDNIKLSLIGRLKDVGISLNLEQVTVLLSRVDSENIIQMSVVFDILKKITNQLMKLSAESGENVHKAKKYYGMHVVLIRVVMFMQDKYIYKIDNVYKPKILSIISKTNTLNIETNKKMELERSEERKTIYRKNIDAQNLTMKVANLYMSNLDQQRDKVSSAKEKASADYELANNTYDTVEVSANLMSLLKTSQDSFDALMKIQVPEIVPFENIEMQRKYEELSNMISK